MVIALDLKGLSVSTGAACSSGAIEPSHVLTAMGLSPDRARGSIRFSLGKQNDRRGCGLRAGVWCPKSLAGCARSVRCIRKRCQLSAVGP